MARSGSLARMASALVAAVLLAACAFPSTKTAPPASSTPELVKRDRIGADAIYWDALNPDGFWVAKTGANYQFEGPSGVVAPPIPGHETEKPLLFRGLHGGDVFVCLMGSGDSTLAHFAGGAWTLTPISSIDTTRQLNGCSELDARSPTDVWLLSLGTVCHLSGSTWSCRYLGGYEPYRMLLTDSHVWFTGGLSTGAFLVMDSTIADAPIVPIGDGDQLDYGLDPRPVPGAEQVWISVLTGNATAYALFDPNGQVRKHEGGQKRDVIPVGPDHEYVLDVSTDDCVQNTASPCSVTATWSQLVVSEYKGGATTPVAHLDDLTGDHVPHAGRLLGGALYLDGEPAYRLP